MARKALDPRDARLALKNLHEYVQNRGGWLALEATTGLPGATLDGWRQHLGVPELAHLVALARGDHRLDLHWLLTGERRRFRKLDARPGTVRTLARENAALRMQLKDVRQRLANLFKGVRAMVRAQPGVDVMAMWR